MSGVDAEIIKGFAAVGLLFLGAVFKHLFDRLAVERGWTREDKRAQDGKIERVDTYARESIQRVESQLGGRLAAVENSLCVLQERVEHLPTADDVQDLAKRVADVDRGLSGVISKVDGMSANVKTILEHILAGERRP